MQGYQDARTTGKSHESLVHRFVFFAYVNKYLSISYLGVPKAPPQPVSDERRRKVYSYKRLRLKC